MISLLMFEPEPSAQMLAEPSNEVQSVKKSVDLMEVTSSEPGTSAQMSTDSLPSIAIPLSSSSPVKVFEHIMEDKYPQFTPRNLI